MFHMLQCRWDFSTPTSVLSGHCVSLYFVVVLVTQMKMPIKDKATYQHLHQANGGSRIVGGGFSMCSRRL